MKSIIIKRGASKDPIRLKNGDLYDSILEVYDDAGEKRFVSNHVNTDSTNGYRGGKLLEGTYYGIAGRRWNEAKQNWMGKRIIALFLWSHDDAVNERRLARIKSFKDLRPEDTILPSAIPNPNHGGARQIQYVQIHDGGVGWDYSHGCITILNAESIGGKLVDGRGEYSEFRDMFEEDEICIVQLI